MRSFCLYKSYLQYDTKFKKKKFNFHHSQQHPYWDRNIPEGLLETFCDCCCGVCLKENCLGIAPVFFKSSSSVLGLLGEVFSCSLSKWYWPGCSRPPAGLVSPSYPAPPISGGLVSSLVMVLDDSDTSRWEWLSPDEGTHMHTHTHKKKNKWKIGIMKIIFFFSKYERQTQKWNETDTHKKIVEMCTHKKYKWHTQKIRQVIYTHEEKRTWDIHIRTCNYNKDIGRPQTRTWDISVHTHTHTHK